jgi:hypothetical protein
MKHFGVAVECTSIFRSSSMPTINHLIVILQAFFPENLELTRALHVLTILPTLYPLMRLHRNQVAQPRQPNETGVT